MGGKASEEKEERERVNKCVDLISSHQASRRINTSILQSRHLWSPIPCPILIRRNPEALQPQQKTLSRLNTHFAKSRIVQDLVLTQGPKRSIGMYGCLRKHNDAAAQLTVSQFGNLHLLHRSLGLLYSLPGDDTRDDDSARLPI
mmetsp:Transcript_20323/g.48344  ORF Transcript_20323/g.48344 Transcript_20323/m.48344 type:complete len:144 (+) Transcript_20323:245-676(+)